MREGTIKTPIRETGRPPVAESVKQEVFNNMLSKFKAGEHFEVQLQFVIPQGFDYLQGKVTRINPHDEFKKSSFILFRSIDTGNGIVTEEYEIFPSNKNITLFVLKEEV